MIDYLDYLVLIIIDEDVCIGFYVGLLGMRLEEFGVGCKVLCFGWQKINIYVKGYEFQFKVYFLVFCVLDLCFIVDCLLDQVIVVLCVVGVVIVEGLVQCSGVIGLIWLIYLCDLDLNLIEILEYI